MDTAIFTAFGFPSVNYTLKTRAPSVLIAALFFTAFAAGIATKGKIIGVLDGDSMVFLTDAQQQIIVRLWGIDCPECSQVYGDKAKQFTANLAYGKTVTVVPHGKDCYGRTLGEVVLDDSINVNSELVRSGLAWWYKETAPGAKQIENLEKLARAEHAGLWADPKPLPPWEFRNPVSDSVVFNPNSKKFHCPSCIWAKRCGRKCIEMTRQDALFRWGSPCKSCGGECK